jgi:outer membrane receptor protein involved in Fe transport
MIMRSLAVSAAAIAIVASVPAPAWAQERTYTFDIPAGDLGAGIRVFAKESRQQVSFDGAIVAGKHGNEVKGTYAPDQALSRLLEGTGVVFRKADRGVFILSAVGNASVAAEAAPSLGEAVAGSAAAGNGSAGETIVVTGTHIRGLRNGTTPVMTYGREEINRSGYLTTEQFIASIPQNFTGGALGASPDGMLGGGSSATENFEHDTTVNLRGLGENSTLVLLNGHRIATSDYGNIVDVSTIPLPAIDHIDVLTDGASAIYGADAVAGVANFVLRQNYDGAETQATYGTAQGGLHTEALSQIVGTSWTTGSIMASYQFQHGSALPSTARSFTDEVAQPTNLINPYTENSVVLNGVQQLADGLTFRGDVLGTWKSTRAVTAYTDASAVRSFSDSFGINASAGLNYEIGRKWNLDVSGFYSRERTDIGFNYDFGFPVPLGRHVQFITTPTWGLEANLNGHPFQLPGGEVGVAVGYSFRKERGTVDYDPAYASAFGSPQLLVKGRQVNAEYAELQLPLVGPKNRIPLVRDLIVSAAIRHDSYSDFGGTTNPKVGVLWSPASFIDFKGNWSRAFRAPSMGELIANVGADQLLVYPPVFPTPSGNSVALLIVQGANPDLRPETATTYDLGFDVHPPSVASLRISFDYYSVNFSNRIETPSFGINLLLQPNLYGSLITPFASDAEAASYVGALEAKGYQLVDVGFGTSLAGVRAAFPTYLINAARVRQNGFDLNARYSFSVEENHFFTSLNVAYINKIVTQFATGAAATDLVNTYGNPLRLRARWEGDWQRGPFELSTAVNFSNAYKNPFVVPPARIASFTTVDVSGGFKLPAGSPLRGTAIRVSAINLFNQKPPFAEGGTNVANVHYDVGNASPVGRLVSVQLTKTW